VVLNGKSESDQSNRASVDWQLVMWRQKWAICRLINR